MPELLDTPVLNTFYRQSPRRKRGARQGRVPENRSILDRPDTTTASERSSRAGPWKQESCRRPAGSGPGERRASGRSQPRYGHDLSYPRYAVALGLSPGSPRAHPRGGHAEPRPGRHTSRRAPGYPALKPPPLGRPGFRCHPGEDQLFGPLGARSLPNAPAGPAHSRRADGRAPPNLAKEFAR